MTEVEVRVGKNLPGWTDEELNVMCINCGEMFGQHGCIPPHRLIKKYGNGNDTSTITCDAFNQDLFSLLVKKALESK